MDDCHRCRALLRQLAAATLRVTTTKEQCGFTWTDRIREAEGFAREAEQHLATHRKGVTDDRR